MVSKYTEELHITAKALLKDGKGLLAADESTGSIEKRFKVVGKDNTEEARREWRDLLFTAEGPIEKYLGGVILFEETLLKHKSNLDTKYKGQPLVEVLQARGIIPGIKTDKGTVTLEGTNPEETTTSGLDGLSERSEKYYEAGARFSKFRSTYTIGETTPSQLAIESNAEVQARFASISQKAGLVPIVEPELLMNGKFTLERSLEAHISVYSHLFHQLIKHQVDFQGLILKASFVVPGDKSEIKASSKEIAEATLKVLSTCVPPRVAGVVFLSGGLGEKEAVENLNALNVLKKEKPALAPWNLSFSFGRALQGTAMEEWSKTSNIKKSQKLFVERANWCHEAALGRYTTE